MSAAVQTLARPLSRPAVEPEAALLQLLARLDARGYGFVPPTPATHARVVARAAKREAQDLRDVFGWSLPFDCDAFDPEVIHLLEQAGALEEAGGGLCKSAVRVSKVQGRLFLHSAYPTEAEDSVFLGPDTYRFADFLLRELAELPEPERIVDIGAGAGVGGILAGLRRRGAEVVLTDVNPQALRLAAINARHAELKVQTVCAPGVEGVDPPIDLALANPPFILDEGKRTYRDGGDMHGAQVSLDWALETARRLSPGGRLLLYTGSAIVDGRDRLKAELLERLPEFDCRLRYHEIDPDIFGEELEGEAYADVERIAAVGAVISKLG